MGRRNVGDRVAWMMGVPPWIEVLRVADALGDTGAIDEIRRIIIRKIKEMYDLDDHEAIIRYNTMILAHSPGLDHIRDVEVTDVRAGL